MTARRKAIGEAIKGMISRVSRIDPNEIDEDIHVRDELGVDSLMAMEIVALCEKRFDIHIAEEDMLGIDTIGDFVSLVVALCEQKSGP
jgi:acyl carrier protein